MTNEKRNYTQDLSDAIATFVADGDASALADAYRTIPSAARGTAMAGSLASAGDRMADVLDVLNNMPASTTSRAKRSLTDAEKGIVRNRLRDAVRDVNRNDDDDDFLTAALDAASEKVIAYVNDRLTFGEKQRHGATLFDVVNAGDTLTGNYRGNTTSALVNADGTIVVGKQSYTSLSAAAVAVVGRAQDGWTFWRKDGATLATLRAAL